LLLALNESLDPELRKEISHRLERVSLNPLENDLEAEAQLAREQYAALLAYAKRPDGLAQKLNRDRRAEMVPLEHGKTEQILFRLANILSFGTYTHREKATPEMEENLDLARRLTYHTRFLRQVAKSGSQVDVSWNLDEVRRSLQFIAEHGAGVGSRTVSATAKIFASSQDVETRRLCLESLTRMNNPRARSELQHISQASNLDQDEKDLINSYLNGRPPTIEPIKVSSQKSTDNRVDQP
jgi:hypothetical protein